MEKEAKRYLCGQAWVEGKWERDVVLAVASDGTWASVLPNASAAQQAGAVRLGGAVVPGVVNAHSHALQRLRAGVGERRGAAGARPRTDRRLNPAPPITPAQLEVVAGQLYAELLLGGYTHVCEFLYLHQTPSDALAMAQALVRAAQRVGMGMTLLPTLAMRPGFGAAETEAESMPFAAGPEHVMRLVEAIERQSALAARPPGAGVAGPVLVGAGVGLHSLSSVGATALGELTATARKTGLPVHIHVAGHGREVDECLAQTGQRPIEWLLAHAEVDARWNLVHATHATPAELQGVRLAGAAIVVCPSTEAHLGHGLFDLPGFAGVGGNWSVGSDRHFARAWPDELRLLAYAHRLRRAEGDTGAQSGERDSSAAALFDAAVAGGRAAAGQRVGPIQVGRRADFAVLDARSPALLGVPAEHLLDALVFSCPTARFSEVYVAGVRVVKDGRVVGPAREAGLSDALADAYVSVAHALGAALPQAASQGLA